VVVAGGTGSRLGGEPKQFRLLGGRPLLAWSCARFRTHPGVDGLVVVLPAELAADPPAWLVAFDPVVVAGGETRQASVNRGLEAACAAGAAGVADEIVLIHDAARPFLSADLLTRLLEAAASGPVIPVVELADAIKRLDSRAHATDSPAATIESTLDRTRLRGAQTPQAFPLELIRDLHARAADDPAATPAPDDAALCESAGVPVQAIPGEGNALKITHAEDLAFAEWLVESGRITWPKES
ncbi:MAG: IspD/TarI family cytidylyltransferase, partial [Gemmatimonadota bacterium]